MQFKFISGFMHGILDWLTAPMLACMARWYGWDRRVTRLHDIVALGTGASAAITDYPLGMVKVMPLKTHLALDKFHGGLFVACAALMDDEPRTERLCMASTGLFLLMTGFCTQTQEKENAPHQDAYARRHPVEQYAQSSRPDIYGSSARSFNTATAR
jgi:hypothetical protein